MSIIWNEGKFSNIKMYMSIVICNKDYVILDVERSKIMK